MDGLVAQLKALAEPTRLRVVVMLARGELTVSELVNILGQSQPRVSRHLKLLTDAGLAERLPEGAYVFYRLTDSGGGRRLAELVNDMVPAGDPIIARDISRLERTKEARAEAAQAYFESVADDWDRIRKLHLSDDEVEREMRQLAGEGPFDLMIDVGVGTGRVLELFADRVKRGIGIDINHSMLNVARSNLENAGLSNCSVRHADVGALPFEEGAADLVTVHQVLHYLDDPALAVAECGRVLRPGGRLLIVDFAPHQLETLREEQHHRRLGFSDEEMGEIIERAGLKLAQQVELHPMDKDNQLTMKIWTAEAQVSD
ncbi:MAG: metalloregulator ArsR/SmtB family transcription factor [Maricaulis sp.]|uniref:ArsR/SmtB family transcription factor n=1 Tax=Maricaulis sp. TaxID=1486257 RepID=UPI001B20D723|nr:metalloregulator ArsR/SmtB family transcription factor [Maricaulis sp.]MBO6728851.1 metalloregulator ArsR/SmtB family transcription factor [Maricaulis sp.]MBO6848165.1 metalloregulator ArsR/SmtB family transcription factor [Maricaulis sp.]MBO6878008.1 metalloregulator ArsR/SmtB family transcription factor [Maricaulis sp.]